MSRRLVHHESFRDYTTEEINKIKVEVCMKHACPYLKNFKPVGLKGMGNPECKACDYISITGHSRGCMPDECTHYLDQNVKKRINPMLGYYQI